MKVTCLKELYEDDTMPCHCPVCRGIRPILIALAFGFICLWLAYFAIGCASAPTHPPQPKPFDEVAAEASCRKIWQEELLRAIDASGLVGCMANLRAGATVEQIAENVRRSQEWADVHAPKPTLQALKADGRIFRTVDGKATRYRGVSAFGLLARYARGLDVQPFLDAYKGFNVLRVWTYVQGPAWGTNAWGAPSADVAKKFFLKAAQSGFYVELTLLTDDKADKLAWAKTYVQQLTAGGCPANLLLEGGNEPRTHKKAIDTAALKPVLAASGCLYASGDYEDPARVYGTYLTHHSQRDAEWPRRAHDCFEWYSGAGPSKPGPPQHKPCALDEPPKPADVNGDKINDWRAYFGAASLMGAGATFHCETCKLGNLPNPEEQLLAAAALEGLNAFPADAPNGGYNRPADKSLRTYIVGNYSVRIRPTTDTHPVSGFHKIGGSRILWAK